MQEVQRERGGELWCTISPHRRLTGLFRSQLGSARHLAIR
jgi:hypothetical protein